MPPTANAGAPPARITFASLPAAVPLDGSGSTPGAGSIVTWAWQIISKPPGSAAALSATNVSNPTLNAVDVPGTYLLILNVEDSVDGWAWDPDPASGGLENTPNTDPTARIAIEALTQYNATVPPALGERTMDAITPGDPGYMNPWEKVYELYEAADATQGELDAFTASPSFDDLYVDNIYEKTAAHTIVMKDDVTCEEDVSIAAGKTLTVRTITSGVGADLVMSAGDDVQLIAADTMLLLATNAMTLGSNDAGLLMEGQTAVTVTCVADSVVIRGGAGDPDLETDVIAPDAALTVTINDITTATITATSTLAVTADGLVSVDAGEGAITLDAQDSITIATSSGGAGTNDITVTAAGDTRVQHAVFTGTTAATSLIAVSGILADDAPGVSVTLDGAGDEVSINAATAVVSGVLEVNTVNERGGGSGVTVEGIRLENEGSNVYAFDVGNATSTLNITGNTDATAPYALTANVYGDMSTYGELSGGLGASGSLGTVLLTGDSAYVNQATTGTGEETLYTYTLPASAMVTNGASLDIYSLWTTAANGNTKVPRTKINGTEIAGASVSTNNGKLEIVAQLVRTGTDTQFWESDTYANGGNVNSRVPTASAFDDGATMAITFTGVTASSAGDLTLLYVRVTLTQE